MNKKEIMKLVAKEMLQKADDKKVECLESYMTGFTSGIEKMTNHLMTTVVSEAKKQNIEIPNELEKIYETLQNS